MNASTESGTARTGILLANLGTPASPSVADVRAYLREFLSDPMVVRAPRPIWWLVLRGIILPFRAPRSAELYRNVWTPAGSPLLFHSRDQARGLAERLGRELPLALGMRYGQPDLRSAFSELRDAGCARVLLVPMFPQESSTTTGTLVARARDLAAELGLELRTLDPFHSHPAYIEALAQSVRRAAPTGEQLHHVFSFHGLPASYVASGDPYLGHCQKTSALLARALALPEERWSLAFQSRFGPQRWLEPYLEPHLVGLASRHERLVLATPGFLADCLETLEELGLRARERFHEAGGKELILVPCLNDGAEFLDGLGGILRERLASGW
ncbi:MAG: ferrochelatase [Planctomycetes bacterium]|nr:ferrochelatase [Planctomycetota bacterium]